MLSWFPWGGPTKRESKESAPEEINPSLEELIQAGWDGQAFHPQEPNSRELWGENPNWDKGRDGNLSIRALILRLTHHFDNIVSVDVKKIAERSVEHIRKEMLVDACNPPINELTQDYLKNVQNLVSKETIAFETESKQLLDRISLIRDTPELEKKTQKQWVGKFKAHQQQIWSDFFVQTLVKAYFDFVDMFATEILQGIRACLLEEDLPMADARRRCFQKLYEVCLKVWKELAYNYAPAYIRVFISVEQTLIAELNKVFVLSEKLQNMILKLKEVGPPKDIKTQDDLDIWHIYIQRQINPSTLKDFVLSQSESLSKNEIAQVLGHRNDQLISQVSQILSMHF